MIDVRNITKVYGKGKNAFKALDSVSFKIPDGVSVAIVGKSGSGKSTLMHIMSGLDSPTEGSVLVDGQNITKMKQKQADRFRAEKISFVFQSFFVQGNESCAENVSLPLEIAGVPCRQRNTKIKQALNKVDLGSKTKAKAKDLSGGQKQRLALARAIVLSPKIIFADEPTGNLDSVTGARVESILFEHSHAKENNILVVVTHDVDLAKKCDMQIVIKDGKVVKVLGGKKPTKKGAGR